jgi:hypothetical protein
MADIWQYKIEIYPKNPANHGFIRILLMAPLRNNLVTDNG